MRSPSTWRRGLIAAAAAAALAPQANATGYAWNIGPLSTSGVPATLGAADTLAIGVGNYKYVDTGLASAGTTTWDDSLYFQNGNAISNSGLWNATADAGFYDGGYGGAFVNSGVFRKSGGSGATTIAGVAFTNSGTVDAKTGSIVFASGNATFDAGSAFTGAGSVQVTSNAAFNGAFSSQNLQLVAGTYSGTAARINGTVAWITGTLGGSWEVAAGQTLNLQAGNYKYLNGALVNNGAANAADNVYLQNGSTLTNNGLYDLQGDVGFGDGGYSGTVSNAGTLRKSAGSGSSTVAGVAFTNSGTVDAQTGSIVFASGSSTFDAGTTFTGAGAVQVTSNATFSGAFTSQNLQLVAGTYTGNSAQVHGTVAWVTGTLAGTWEVAAGQTLDLQAGNYKYVDGAVTNNGTMNAADNLYLSNGNTLTNNGLYDMQGDVGLGDGGYSGTFANAGTFRKSAGTGTSTVTGVTFTNSGTVEARSGTISFNGGTFRFDDGTAFTGAGSVSIGSSATFVGHITTAANLSLDAGTFTGGDGSAAPRAVLDGDARWVTGVLAGQWSIATGRTLTLAPGNYKYVNGAVTNAGTVAAFDSLYFSNGNTLTNSGLYDVRADVGLGDGGYSGTFVNDGTFRKSAGAGSSAITGIAFTNNGAIDAQTGSIDFTGGAPRFNDGTAFTGAGRVNVAASATFVGAYTTSGNLWLSNGTFTGGDGTTGSKATLNGDTHWVTGTLAGTWDVAAGRTLTLEAGNYKDVNGSVTNRGTVAALDSVYLQNGNSLRNEGVYDLRGDVGVGDGGYNGAFVNAGLLVKSAGTGTSSVAGIGFANAAGGIVDVRTGTIQLPDAFVNLGTLKGAGTYGTTGLTNAGHVAPGSIGAPPGRLTVTGSFAQTAAGSFDVGMMDASSFGNLLVGGAASLAGTLDLACVGSCSFAVGTELVLLHSNGPLAGTFDSIVETGFAAGAFSIAYLANDVVLTVTQQTIAAVPEPHSVALLLAGLAAVGFVARRRR